MPSKARRELSSQTRPGHSRPLPRSWICSIRIGSAPILHGWRFRWRARDTSLRGVSQAVLRSYPGVEGGYHDGNHFLGYSYPTHDTGEKKIDVPTAELDDILTTISQGRVAGVAQRILRGQHDIVVIEAKADRQNGFVSWTMKRLTGRSEPGTTAAKYCCRLSS